MFKQFAVATINFIYETKNINSQSPFQEQFVEDFRRGDVITTTKECKAKTFSTEQEAADFMRLLPTKVFHANGKYTTSHNYRLTAIEYEFANYQGYSDVNPYEIVKVVSPKTLEIRAMDSNELPWEKDFRAGGFCGTMVNQRDQKWDITRNKENQVIRIRLGKKGWVDSHGNRHTLSQEPHKFHDYNF